MSICSYLVIPGKGAAFAVAARLTEIPGCDLIPAAGHELLLLVTETDTAEAERALRTRIEALEGVRALLMTFGDVDPAAAPPTAVRT